MCSVIQISHRMFFPLAVRESRLTLYSDRTAGESEILEIPMKLPQVVPCSLCCFTLVISVSQISSFLIESGAYPAHYNAGQNMHATVIPSLFLLLISTSICFMFLHACLLCFSRTPVSNLVSARYCFMECLCQGWPHRDDKIYQLGWIVFIEPLTKNFH